jgi:hypothetical protein
VQGSEVLVRESWFRLQASWFLVQGSGFGSGLDTVMGHRGPLISHPERPPRGVRVDSLFFDPMTERVARRLRADRRPPTASTANPRRADTRVQLLRSLEANLPWRTMAPVFRDRCVCVCFCVVCECERESLCVSV